MADKKISQLTASATPLDGAELVPIVKSSSTVRVAVSDLTAGRAVSMLSATLSGGVANGVVYLNASKVAASGSELVFDGTNLGVGAATPASKLEVRGTFGTGTTAATISNGSAASASNIARLDFRLVNSFGGLERSAAIWGLNPNAAGNNGGALVFGTSANGTATAPTERARIDANGNIVAGASAALATTATDGFLYVPTCAGVPTGTPTAITGMAPIVVDTTNNRWYFYSNGAWRNAGP